MGRYSQTACIIAEAIVGPSDRSKRWRHSFPCTSLLFSPPPPCSKLSTFQKKNAKSVSYPIYTLCDSCHMISACYWEKRKRKEARKEERNGGGDQRLERSSLSMFRVSMSSIPGVAGTQEVNAHILCLFHIFYFDTEGARS